MSKRTAFYHDERCLWHTTGEHALVMPVGGWVQPVAAGGHAESAESKRRIVSLVNVSGLGGDIDILSAPLADEADLERVHPRDYLTAFKAASDAGGGDLGDYAPFGRGSYEIAKLSTGLGIRAVDDVISGRYRNAYAMTRPPGHHCLANRSMGFCLLANVAVAVETAMARHGLGRVLILDWDVHHGNGTQSIFEQRGDVYTISIHQDRCFPPGYSGFEERGVGDGEGANLNIPLLPGSGHDAYLYAFERLVEPVIEFFKPDLLVIASGLDANAADPLARMQATSATFAELTRRMVALADRHCGGRLVALHEGGYSEAVVPFCGLAIVETLSGVKTAVEDPFLPIFNAQQPNERFVAFQRTIIDEMAATLGL